MLSNRKFSKKIKQEFFGRYIISQLRRSFGSRLGCARFSKLLALKESGVVGKIGVSVYTPEELEVLVERYRLDLVQVPFNVFDQRFCKTGWFGKLKTMGVEIHCRSLFLQGVLLKKLESLPDYFDQFSAIFKQYHGLRETLKISPIESCLLPFIHCPLIDAGVVGVCSSDHLVEIIESYNISSKKLNYKEFFISNQPNELIMPNKWEIL